MPSSKRRAQGGGRKANSEPRLQVFSQFDGCNFELSPRDFTLGKNVDQEQSDMEMNYVVIQNNAGITSNKTIETRNNLVKLFNVPSGRKFTDACLLVGDEFYVGLDNGDLAYTTIGSNTMSYVQLEDQSSQSRGHHWRSFAYIDDKLAGVTEENQLWTGDIEDHLISNAQILPDPLPLEFSDLVPKGKLRISQTQDNTYAYRIAIAYTYVGKYGPTACSDQLTFYANYPVDEWHSGRYLRIHLETATTLDIKAIEIYYTTGNSSSLVPAGRTDEYVRTWHTEGGVMRPYNAWNFDFFGYLDATSMWPIVNLIAPTQNYTEGPKASHMTVIDGRIYFWGDSDNPERLYIGGNPGNLFSISSGTGGGFVDVEPGTGQDIRIVTKYKTQSGASIVTMLCNSENSTHNQRFNLVENTVSLSNEQSMKSWQAEQVAGAIGCKSYRGAVVCEDGLYAINNYGLALTTMTMEYNSQIRANYVSDPIKPAFTNRFSNALKMASLLEVDGVLYMAFGKYTDNAAFLATQGSATYNDELDNMLFCYDIDKKVWWTITLDVDEPILNMFNVDYEGAREGLGIITENAVYLLPLTQNDSPTQPANFPFIIQTGELSTQQPQQAWQYLSQMEFRFDYFIGTAVVVLTGIDQFGRKVSTRKTITHNTAAYDLAEYMRVDLRLQSYQIRITGTARFRMTHFIAKVYTMSNKQGLVWGFDDSQSYRSSGDIHPTFLDYNDIHEAIIP